MSARTPLSGKFLHPANHPADLCPADRLRCKRASYSPTGRSWETAFATHPGAAAPRSMVMMREDSTGLLRTRLRGSRRIHASRSPEVQALHMIQGAATRTLDLELRELAHTGEQSFATTASALFEHLAIPLISTAQPTRPGLRATPPPNRQCNWHAPGSDSSARGCRWPSPCRSTNVPA